METVETINLVDEYNKLKTENEQLRDALSEAIEFADQDCHALTPTGETMISRWRSALQQSALQQKDTEKLSQMMIRCGLATGHGDTIDDLIFELEKQIRNTLNAFSDARKQIERLREALERIANSSNWGGDGCWDADSYPNEIAEEALKEKE
jgi:regulator of replication initiation timing